MTNVLFQSLNRQLSPSDVFGHWELLDALNRVNQELGLIIDLTYTTRYYKMEVRIFRLIYLFLFFSFSREEKTYALLCVFVRV